jgi:hypothetical protein
MPDACQPARLLALVAPSKLPHRHPSHGPSMAHDASASASALPLLTRPRALVPPAFQRHHFTLPRLFHCFSCLQLLHHILPAFHLVSCVYPPTPIAAPWYPREPHYCAPTRSLLPTSHPNRRLPVSPTPKPSPSQPTQTQPLLRCTAATCDPLRRLIDPLRHLLDCPASSQPLLPFIWIASLPFQNNLNNPPSRAGECLGHIATSFD